MTEATPAPENTLLLETKDGTVTIELLPDLAPGDSFAIGADLLTVSHATRDGSGTAWRVYCQR